MSPVAGADHALSSFNARTMSTVQVAASFVPPSSFELLIKPDNSLLSGPRGAGKTTLLKMLQPEALEAWTDPRAAKVRAAVGYTGVFIATDRTWKKQLFPANVGESSIAQLEYIADAAFTTHVLREIVSAMAFRAHSPEPPIEQVMERAAIDQEAELHLVDNLAKLASLSVEVPSLQGVADALTLRLAVLGSYRNVVREGGDRRLPSWMDLDCLSTAEAAVDLFNAAANQREHQWALLFDELELAPDRIVNSLLDAMRGQGGSIIFKLSLSPVQPELATLQLPHSGVHGQDFEFIRLTYAGQRQAHVFASALVAAEMERRFGPNVSVDQLLGPSAFSSTEESDEGEGRRKRARNPYAKNSPLWKTYRSLEKADASFAEWLKKREIDLDDLERLSADQRSAQLRKIRNLVVVRQFYRASPSRRRSRKTYSLYTGADALLTFVDGNPRMLKALLGELFTSAPAGNSRISVTDQSRAVENILGRFLALIRSLPGVTLSARGQFRVIELLDVIGDAFTNGVVDAPFRDNAPLSFRVDARLPAHVIEALQLALNAGAIVHVPREAGRQIPGNLNGETFRLSYVLAPHYGLPLRLGPATSLHTLMSRSRAGRALLGSSRTSRIVRVPPGQPSLFEENQS